MWAYVVGGLMYATSTTEDARARRARAREASTARDDAPTNHTSTTNHRRRRRRHHHQLCPSCYRYAAIARASASGSRSHSG